MSQITLKNRLRVLRAEHRMSQAELALRTGVSRQTILSIESGTTVPSTLLAFKIAKALGVPVTDIFTMEGELLPV